MLKQEGSSNRHHLLEMKIKRLSRKGLKALGIFKSQRLPPGDLWLSFGGIALVIHVWAITHILIKMPLWQLRMNIWELVGAISYTLVDALLESSIFWIGFVVLSYILPKKWLADKFAVLSSVLVWLLCFWAIYFQIEFNHVLEWGPKQILLGILLVVISCIDLYWLIHRIKSLEDGIKRFVRPLAILAYCYVLFDLLGLVIIVVRNL